MTSTQLLITQAAILILLFGIVIWVVRSSARQIRNATPPPITLDDPVDTRPAPPLAHVAPPPTPVAPPVPAAPNPAPVAVAAAVPAGLGGAEHTESEVDEMGRERASFDFDANLHPRLVIESGPGLTAGTELPLEGGLSIGRAPTNGLPVEDSFMSHMHARILRRGTFFYVEDLGSTNGTFVNDQRITGDAQLRVRDQIRLGETVLRYEE
jgi:hypothetical protein